MISTSTHKPHKPHFPHTIATYSSVPTVITTTPISHLCMCSIVDISFLFRIPGLSGRNFPSSTTTATLSALFNSGEAYCSQYSREDDTPGRTYCWHGSLPGSTTTTGGDISDAPSTTSINALLLVTLVVVPAIIRL